MRVETQDSHRMPMSPIRSGGLSLLVVAHDEATLETLVSTLRASVRAGEVESALGGYRGLLSASRRKYGGVFIEARGSELDGLEIMTVLNEFAAPPAVVVVAESDALVARAFGLGAVDYLIEPVTPERVEQALTRLEESVGRGQVAQPTSSVTPTPGDEAVGERVVVGSGRDGGPRLLVPKSILYLQAYGDYIRVFADSGRYLIRGRLTDAAVTLEARGFLRVHRAYLANLRRATGIEMFENGTALLRLDDEHQVPVSRRHVHELRERLKAEVRLLGTAGHAVRRVQGAPVP